MQARRVRVDENKDKAFKYDLKTVPLSKVGVIENMAECDDDAEEKECREQRDERDVSMNGALAHGYKMCA